MPWECPECGIVNQDTAATCECERDSLKRIDEFARLYAPKEAERHSWEEYDVPPFCPEDAEEGLIDLLPHEARTWSLVLNVIGLIVLFALLIWPSPYSYGGFADIRAKTNRLTGKTSLVSDGHIAMRFILTVPVLLYAWHLWPSRYYYRRDRTGKVFEIHRVTGKRRRVDPEFMEQKKAYYFEHWLRRIRSDTEV